MTSKSTPVEGLNALTPEQYVESAGIQCPICHTQNVRTTGSLEADGTFAIQHVKCGNCGAAWTDEYRLIGYSDLEPEGD